MHQPTDARPIPGYPAYLATSSGRIYSTYRGGRWLHTHPDRHGYLAVNLYAGDGRRGRLHVHHIVLLTFVGPRPHPSSVARHLNGDRLDNRIENLAWGTQAENIADGMRQGSMPQIGRRGEDAHAAKLTEEQVLEIEQRANAGEPTTDLAREFGICRRHVYTIRRRQVWQHLWSAA